MAPPDNPKPDIDALLVLVPPRGAQALALAWDDPSTRPTEDLRVWGGRFCADHPAQAAYFEILEGVLMRATDWHVRRAVVRWLSQNPGPHTRSALVVALHDRDPDVRVEAANALADLDEIDTLLDALTDRNHRVRQAAARALGKTQNLLATAPLIRALGDKYAAVVQAAAQSLTQRNNREAAPYMAARLVHRDTDKRWLLHQIFAQALEVLGDESAAPALISRLAPGSVRYNAANRDTSLCVFRALLSIHRCNIGPPPVSGTVERRTAFAGRGRSAVLSRLTGEANIERLCVLLDASDDQKKCVALTYTQSPSPGELSQDLSRAAVQIAQSRALPWLQELLSHPDPRHIHDNFPANALARACIQSLVCVPSPKTTEVLSYIISNPVGGIRIFNENENLCIVAARSLAHVDPATAQALIPQQARVILSRLLRVYAPPNVDTFQQERDEKQFASLLQTLVKNATSETQEFLFHCLQRDLPEHSPLQIVRDSLCETLATLENPDVLPIITRRIQQRSASVAEISLFAKINRADALKPLALLLRDGHIDESMIRRRDWDEALYNALSAFVTPHKPFEVLILFLAHGCAEGYWSAARSHLKTAASQWLQMHNAELASQERRCLDEILACDLRAASTQAAFDALWRWALRSEERPWQWALFCWQACVGGQAPQLRVDGQPTQWRNRGEDAHDFLCTHYQSDCALALSPELQPEGAQALVLRFAWSEDRAVAWLQDLILRFDVQRAPSPVEDIQAVHFDQPHEIKRASDALTQYPNNTEYTQRLRLPFYALTDLHR